jgi:hypothetical protein
MRPASVSGVIQVVSPIAFVVLAGISILLILNLDISNLFPRARIPSVENPYLGALL